MIHYYGSCRTLCWGSVTLLLLNISVTGIVRLLCVVQVSVCSGMETLTYCQLLSVVQIPPRGPWDPLHLSDNIPNDLGWSYAHRLQCELFEVTFYRIFFLYGGFFSKFPNCVDNNLVSYLSQMKRTSLDKDFLSLFVYISLALTFVVLVFTYITIHLYLRLRHSESIKIAERTRHAFKDNIVSLKTMILLVLAGSTVALYHVYNNSLGIT